MLALVFHLLENASDLYVNFIHKQQRNSLRLDPLITGKVFCQLLWVFLGDW